MLPAQNTFIISLKCYQSYWLQISIESCTSKCFTIVSCSFWSYNVNTGTCYLIDNGLVLEAVTDPNITVYTGNWTCTSPRPGPGEHFLIHRHVRWEPEIWPFEIRKHLKSGLFEGWISNGWALPMAIAKVPEIWKWTIQNLDVLIPIPNGFWQNGGHGWASGFQIPFKIQTILQPNLFWTIQNPD